jgi:hypothetical protein
MLLLPNLAAISHAKAKGLLVFFGCSVGSYHACSCNKHVTCDGAVTNNVAACVMHVEVKVLLVFFGCNVGSCDFNVLLVLLLPILTGVRHAKAKGMLILFGCNVGSCHACSCSKYVTCDGAVLMVVSQTMLLCVSCMLRPELYWFSLDAMLGHVILMFC